MHGKDIVIVGQQPWDTEIGSNCKNIALELSKTNRVLYVNSPLDRITKIRNRADQKVKKRIDIIKGNRDGLERIHDNLWTLYPDCIVESINWIYFTSVFNFFNYANNRKLSKSIQKSLKRLDFQDFILFNDNEIFKAFYLKDFLKPKLSIYYSRDYMVGVEYWKRHGEKLEPELIKKSDLCVSNSMFLKEYCQAFNGNSFYVGQGCDLDIFNPNKISDLDLADVLEWPVIGYIGALQSIRLDIEIIREIAINRPEWTILLVGPEDEVFLKSNLHQIANIKFYGSKPYHHLPFYLSKFDVAINPQAVNNLTIGNYPRKIDEYLAMGKPVVATMTKTMQFFSNYVYLADSKEDFPLLIEQALKEDSAILREKRRKYALTHSWENSVAEIGKVVDLVENSKKIYA